MQYVCYHGVSNQSMVRDLLNRFAQAELKMILQEKLIALEEQGEVSRAESTDPVNQFMDMKKQA